MMSRAASQAMSRNYVELLLWKALTGQLPPRSPSVKCIRSTRAFVAQRRWHWPRVRGLNPTVVAYCENTHAHCILIQFNLDQVSSRRLYEGSCSVERDARGSGGWDASGKWKKIRSVVNKAICRFWMWAEGVLSTQSMFSCCPSASFTRVCWLFFPTLQASSSDGS